MKKRLAIVSSHPIQYNAPLFRTLASQPELEVMVFYTWSQTSQGGKFDPLFGKVIEWDIPLLDGYAYRFVENVAKDPGSHHFRGIRNPDLIATIHSFRPDAILVFGWSFQSHLECLRYFHGRIPVMFRGDSTLLGEHRGVKQVLRRIFLTWVYRHVDIALYVGQHNKAYYLRHGLRENQLRFAPHAIDNARFSAEDALRNQRALERRRALGIRDTDMVVLFAGKLEPRKNPFFIVELARQCPLPGLVFMVVGNGPLEAQVKEMAKDLPGLVFMDFQNQEAMPEIYRMGNVFLLPSVSETWGLALNESMVCKRPVIASRKVGAVPDLILEDETGWSFEPGPGAVDQVAAIVRQLHAAPQRCAEAGEAAYAHIAAFSYDAISRTIVHELTGSVNHKPAALIQE